MANFLIQEAEIVCVATLKMEKAQEKSFLLNPKTWMNANK